MKRGLTFGAEEASRTRWIPTEGGHAVDTMAPAQAPAPAQEQPMGWIGWVSQHPRLFCTSAVAPFPRYGTTSDQTQPDHATVNAATDMHARFVMHLHEYHQLLPYTHHMMRIPHTHTRRSGWVRTKHVLLSTWELGCKRLLQI